MIDSNKLVAKPFGKEKASLYVLIDYPDPDDVRFGSLGEGLKSRYLRTFYDGLKFSDYRMNSLVPRVTKKVENGRSISVPPTSLEIYDNLGNVANDIINSGATTILAVGSTVLKTILDDNGMTLRKSHNLVKSVTLGGKKISVIPTYSPTFLSSHGNDIELGSEFYRDLLKSIKLSNGTYVDILDNVEINACKTFSEFKNFVDNNMKDDTTFTFDYETNAIDVHREGFLPVGFSVANKGNSTDRKLRGTYVILDSLDYHMSDEDKKKSLEYVKNMIVNVKDRVGRYKGLDYKKYLNEKKPDATVGYDDGRTLEGKVIVHNSMYERPATVNIMNYEIPYDDLDDTLVMAKLLLGGKVGAGLKPQAQSIGYPDWETDLNDYMKGFLRLADSSRKELYKMAVNNRWNDIYSVKYYTRTNVTSYILSHLKDLFTQLSDEFNLSSKQLALVNNKSLLTASPEQVDWDVIEAIMKMVDDLVNIKLNTRSVKKSVYLRDKYGDYSKSKLDDEHDDIMKDFKSHYPELVKVSQIYSYSNIYTEALLETVKLKEQAKKKGKAPVPNLLESTINFIDLINEYYTDSKKLKFVLSKVSEKLVEFQSSEYRSIIPYSWIPSNLIEKYGAMDAVATYDVEDNFLRRMVSESNHEVNLFKGYEVYLRQHFMGYVMEQNGMYWNDDAAQKIKNDMNNNAIISMKYMARHPLMKEYFKNKFFDEIAPEIIYENKAINEYFADHYKRKVVVAGKNNQYKMVTLDPVQNDDGTPQVYENGSQVYKESRPLAIKYFFNGAATKTIKIEDVEEIDPKIKEFISERVVDKVYELIDNCKYYDDAKEYFNPMSTQGKDYENLHDVMTNILLTDNYKYGSAIYNISALNDSKPSRSDKKDAGNLLEACSEYTNLKRDYEDEDDPEHEKYIKENYVKIKKQKWPELIKLLDEYYVKIGSPTSYEAPRDRKGNIKETHKLYDVFCTSMFPQVFETSKTGYVNYLDSSDGGIISMYQHMKQFPIDLENPNDWKDFPEFTWMYNFRLFKKSAKLITTYVEGRIGRQNVWTVDKKLLQAGELRLPRKTLYDDLPKDDNGKAILPEGDALLLQTRFGVNTADTGRWRSGVHTIPAGSFIKKMYTSRYKGGSICMPDFSQNEIRSLSSSAHEENMQKSFAAGADIHAENAKLIFNKENISHAERRFAKTATFSILYGAAPQSFADNYLDGDIKRAQEIYDRFFSAFPKIKEWREHRFEEVEKTGKVATMTNRFISIKTYDKQNDPYKFEEELRQAGNYPIQGSSSDVAGCTMFQIDQNTRKLNLKDKFFVFIHDSLESDCPPFELLRQVAFQQDILANYATEEFGMICKADMELGYSFGHEITLEKIDSDEDYDEATLVLSGYKDEIEDTVNNWKTVYSVAEITDTDYKDEYQPTDLFFTPRHAMPDKVRIDRQKGEATIHIRYYDD